MFKLESVQQLIIIGMRIDSTSEKKEDQPKKNTLLTCEHVELAASHGKPGKAERNVVKEFKDEQHELIWER